MQYSESDLARLHLELEDILREIIRVCDCLGINYFIIGGTAIGAFYNKGIIPWDDDIDIGMKRAEFKRFIAEAPAVLAPGYFLQSFESEPETPFFFIKVRKDGTSFIESSYVELDIHHGIFVDIFPFDNIPDSSFAEAVQRRLANFAVGCFKRSVLRNCVRDAVSFLPPAMVPKVSDALFSIIRLVPRKFWYRQMCFVQELFNRKETAKCNIVIMPNDQIPNEDIEHLTRMPFGSLVVSAPGHFEKYLRHRYPSLQPVPPPEKRINHAPNVLSFND